MYDLARGMVYVYHMKDDPYQEVDSACIEMTRALIQRLENELKGLAPNDPKGAVGLELATRIIWFWGSRDYAAAEKAYKLIAEHDDPESRRAR